MERLAHNPGILPDIIEELYSQSDKGWKVTVFNNETNSYEEVMSILMIATGCDSEEAYIETWEIDHYGQCVVHRANQELCEFSAKIIGTIGIKVEVAPDLE